ncbi:MAG: GNAT family N-acetyltransferase [Anaerolineae bacterium]|nr:GNAT family N-acetyltransferase [Anaerolineae bacterium]
MNLETYTTPDAFDALRAEWNPLLERSGSNLVFLTHEWLQTWWDVYQPGDLWVIVGRTDDGQLAGIAPWFIQQQEERRVVRAIGCVEVTDYLSVIADREHEQAYFTALSDHLAATEDVFDAIGLCNIPTESPTLALLPDLLQARGFTVTTEVQEVCPLVPLTGDWEDYLSRLDKKQRHEVRRKLRRAHATTAWHITGPDADISAATEQFLHLMAASSPDKAVFLQDEQNEAFMRAIILRMWEAGWLQLTFLTVNSDPAATYLNFDYNNRVLVYNSGQDVTQYGALSPGIVLLAHTIRHAIDSGREVFDFLRGNEPYKYQMGGQDTQIHELTATRP